MSESASSEPSGVRTQLADQANINVGGLSSSRQAPTITKPLRHKVSSRALQSEADLSDYLASSPGSIYNAMACCSGSENIDPKDRWEQAICPGQTIYPVFAPAEDDECSECPPCDIYYPTQLETIKEQQSKSTICPSRSLSLRTKASIISRLSKRVSQQRLMAEAQARHKASFSLDDLTNILRRPSRIFAWQSSSQESSTLPSPIEQLYPNRPVMQPPVRWATPPGLPTFNTPEASDYRLTPPSTRLRNLFRVSRTPAEREYIEQTVRLPRGVVMQGGDDILVRGRWMPSQSGHTGNSLVPPPLRMASDSDMVQPLGMSANALAPRSIRGTGNSLRHVTFSNCTNHAHPTSPTEIDDLVASNLALLAPDIDHGPHPDARSSSPRLVTRRDAENTPTLRELMEQFPISLSSAEREERERTEVVNRDARGKQRHITRAGIRGSYLLCCCKVDRRRAEGTVASPVMPLNYG